MLMAGARDDQGWLRPVRRSLTSASNSSITSRAFIATARAATATAKILANASGAASPRVGPKEVQTK